MPALVPSLPPISRLPGILAIALVVPSPAQAIEESLQELRLPPLLVESEVRTGHRLRLPPPTYPVEHVDQLPFHGAWHEFMNAKTGGLVFHMPELRLPGRMPVYLGRVQGSTPTWPLPRASSGKGSGTTNH